MVEKQENIVLTEVKKRKQNRYGITIVEKPLSVNEQIKFYIDAGKSFMLHGPSGVGKTRRIEEIDPNFVSIVLRNGMLPEEVIGKQIYPNNDKTTTGIWTPPAWYTKLCKLCEEEPNKNHVLFIDEITNVKPTEQSLVYNLVLTNSIGPNLGKLPSNVVVVAAGNSKEESESAYNMPEPLFRRFEAHIELKPNIQDWLIWGSEPRKENSEQTKIHPLVSAFVATYGEKVFYTKYDSEEPPKFAIDPRGWEQISDIIYSNNGAIAKELIENKVGKEIAASFIKFAKNPPLTLDDVLEGNYDKTDIPTKYDAKYALAMGLKGATEEQVKTVREFIANNLGNEILSVFDATWVGDNNERAILIENQNIQSKANSKTKQQTQPINRNYKITIDDWWDSATFTYDLGAKGVKAIIIKNKKELDTLLKVFDEKNITEINKTKIKNSKFDIFIFNDLEGRFYGGNSYVDYEDKKRLEKMHRHTEFYNFDEIDFTDYLTQEEIDELKKIKRFKIL